MRGRGKQGDMTDIRLLLVMALLCPIEAGSTSVDAVFSGSDRSSPARPIIERQNQQGM